MASHFETSLDNFRPSVYSRLSRVRNGASVKVQKIEGKIYGVVYEKFSTGHFRIYGWVGERYLKSHGWID